VASVFDELMAETRLGLDAFEQAKPIANCDEKEGCQLPAERSACRCSRFRLCVRVVSLVNPRRLPQRVYREYNSAEDSALQRLFAR
jgi:hypothetical protein